MSASWRHDESRIALARIGKYSRNSAEKSLGASSAECVAASAASVHSDTTPLDSRTRRRVLSTAEHLSESDVVVRAWAPNTLRRRSSIGRWNSIEMRASSSSSSSSASACAAAAAVAAARRRRG